MERFGSEIASVAYMKAFKCVLYYRSCSMLMGIMLLNRAYIECQRIL